MTRSLSLCVAFGLLLAALTGCTGGPGPLPDDQTSGTGSAERPPSTGESGSPGGPGRGEVDRGPDDDDDDDDSDERDGG